MVATLQAVSPLSVLSRGYAIAFSRTKRGRKPILDPNQVHVFSTELQAADDPPIDIDITGQPGYSCVLSA